MEESRVLPRKTLVLSLLLFSLSLAAAPASWKVDTNALQSQLDAGITGLTFRAGLQSIALDVERVTRNAAGDFVVRARVGVDGWAVLSSSDRQWYGNVRTGTRSYELRHNVLVDVTDEPELPGLPPAVTRKAPAVRQPHPESLDAATNAEEPVVVDVLMVYTSKLHETVSETDIRNVAVAAIEETNLAY